MDTRAGRQGLATVRAPSPFKNSNPRSRHNSNDKPREWSPSKRGIAQSNMDEATTQHRKRQVVFIGFEMSSCNLIGSKQER